MYSMVDYRNALNERNCCDINTQEWDLAQMKVVSIVAAMVASGDRSMVRIVEDEVYSLNDCGFSLSDNAIQHDLWLLRSNGYEKEAARLMDLEWE